MDKQKLTKGFTLLAVIVSSVAFLGSSAIGIWQLAQAPAPIRLPSNSAQAETQWNSALETLGTKPEDADANQSLELVLQFYASRGDRAKLIQILEKQQQVAPSAPNASRYRQVLAQLKTPASPSSTPTASPGKPSNK